MGLVVHNRYFVLAGKKTEALGVRRQASAVRRGSGRPAGRILVAASADADGPDFIWECDYPSSAARDDDAAWAAASEEFESVRRRMAPLLARFERQIFLTGDEPAP